MSQIPAEKLKEFLIQDKLITPEEFDALLLEAVRLSQDVVDILVSRNIISSKYFVSLLSRYFGVDHADINIASLDESLVRLLPEDVARSRRAVIFKKNEDGSFDVAMENPSDLETIEFLSSLLKTSLNPFLATSEDLNQIFSVYSQKFTKDFKELIEENIRASLGSKSKGLEEAAADVPIVALVNNVVSYAFSLGSSDIHFEPLETSILIRFRVDGILREIVQIPVDVLLPMVARIKLLASLKLDEHSKPQDGRFRYKIGKEVIDIRVSIMPTFHGEKAVLRLLPSTQKPMSLEELGIAGSLVPIVKENIKKSFGMIIVCGPTGSGKTTTLYSILNMLNTPEVNIVTVEDPIEYEIKYVNQTQINAKAGITFANGLRSILRQDPNIILVGEIRDEETADISVNAALTGHLLLSSLHTNDATTAIPRLLDMKIPPFLVSAVLNIIIAQRLVRKICSSCIASFKPSADVISSIKRQLKEIDPSIENPVIPKVLYKGAGCPVCGGTGYKGRIGIFEILNVSENIRNLITDRNFSLDSLKSQAKKEGMSTMFEDGIKKAELGSTTIEEILRVIRE
ncbi:MAG: GspE/PulE family protein [Candidatus Paceibacterota bacterium]